MWSLILRFFPGIVNGVLTYLNKKQDVGLEKYKVDGAVDMAAVAAAVELSRAQAEMVKAEQGHWLTRSVRPAFGWIMVVYFGKVVVYDIVLGLGSTPALKGSIAEWGGVIILGYFAATSAETIARVLRR